MAAAQNVASTGRQEDMQRVQQTATKQRTAE
jgi:hypothetical protein